MLHIQIFIQGSAQGGQRHLGLNISTTFRLPAEVEPCKVVSDKPLHEHLDAQHD